MSDLRARLADALGKASYQHTSGGTALPVGDAVDVLLSLPGIAVVELPGPDSTRYEGDEHEPMDRLCWMPGDDFEVSVWDSGEIQRCGYGWGDCEPLRVAEARTVAAALLAAAAAAEQGGSA